MVNRSQLIMAALLLLVTSTVRAVEHEPSPEKASAKASSPAARFDSVDHIKGIGKYKFGAKLADFPVDSLQPVDAKAKGKLLRVSPYGDNYLVTDLTGLTWGGLPLAALIVTFHEGVLVDIQITLKARKIDLYVVNRAFKDKYGPNNPRTLPIETWSGDRIQVTLILVKADVLDPTTMETPGEAKVEFFDQATWLKFEAASKAKLDEILDQRYEQAAKKAKTNL